MTKLKSKRGKFGIKIWRVWLACLLGLVGCASPNTTPVTSPLSIVYHLAAEATYKNIEVNQSQLTYTFFEDTQNKCANWVAQSPCWTDNDLQTKQIALSTAEVTTLVNLIRQTDFMKLGDTYGGAAEGIRYYAYTLKVQLADEQKEVIYQSFPGSEAKPEAFEKLEARLRELVQEKIQ
jgi:hypothetical protein